MSKIVGIEQHKKLRKLGFPMVESCKDEITGQDIVYAFPMPYNESEMRLPKLRGDITLPEALDWIREEKGIECCVFFNNELFGNLDNAKAIYYYKYGCNGRIIYNSWNVDYKSFDTHLLAESSLLDAVLDYLSIK